jgi:hypothetical protein
MAPAFRWWLDQYRSTKAAGKGWDKQIQLCATPYLAACHTGTHTSRPRRYSRAVDVIAPRFLRNYTSSIRQVFHDSLKTTKGMRKLLIFSVIFHALLCYQRGRWTQCLLAIAAD